MSDTIITAFDKKVVEFKALFAAAPTLVDSGQFQVSNAIKLELGTRVAKELGALMLREDPIYAAAINFFDGSLNDDSRVWADDVLAAIKGSRFEDKVPVTKAIFTKDPTATEAWAAAQYAAVWGSAGMKSASTAGALTADKAIAAWRYERYKCGATAKGMASKVTAARGSGLTANNANYQSTQIANAQLKPSGNREIISYDPKLLDDAVAKIVAGMGKGYLYRFGVQSGMRHENQKNPYPAPEHYLLAFAEFDGHAFLFWDPDGATSNIASRPWGEGFGVIYHRNGRLSTAYDENDFQQVASNYHLLSPRRHLYQVNAAIPLP